MTDILQAARSYYGLADTESCTTQLFTNQAGQTCVAFEIPLSNEDFTAIVDRMKAMQQEYNPETGAMDSAIIEGPTVEAMREAYNALSKAEKGRYGSFARYMAESSGGILEGGYREGAQRFIDACEGRQIVHVDAPEEPEPVSMDAVWLLGSQIPAELQFLSSDQRVNTEYGDIEYLIPWAMLTDEQKQKAKESGK